MKAIQLVLLISVVVLGACEKAEEAEPPKPSEVESPEAVSDVSPSEAAELLKEEAVVVLDVRTPEEYAEGHIANAVNIDFKDPAFGENIAGLEKEKSYLVHCRSGGRSAEALKQLETLGLEKIYHLTSGMNGWQEAGLPVVE